MGVRAEEERIGIVEELENFVIQLLISIFKPIISPLCPIATVKVTVSDGFGNVHSLYFFAASEVGNGAGHLEDAAVGTG